MKDGFSLLALVASFTLLTAQVSLAAANTLPEDRPWELVLQRNTVAQTCSMTTLRNPQKHRGISGNLDAVSTSLNPAVPEEERVSIISYDHDAVWARARTLCSNLEGLGSSDLFVQSNALGRLGQSDQYTFDMKFTEVAVPPPKLEIEPLIISGPSANRMDLVFFSDGYLASEKSKFLEDALRLADDVSNNHTFNTVQPLLNFWAAFTASDESGVGVGGEPKNTTYGLYRDGTELRGVYYSKPKVARAACLSMGDQCDYPILMGNDPFYGGLGGEFTVITPSLANGALVLRHELGHSIIDVGEEYDGANTYFGVNTAVPNGLVPWTHWLTTPKFLSGSGETESFDADDTSVTRRRVERSVMPMQAYPWTILNTTSAWSVKFNSSGTYSRHLVRFSLSGLPESSDLLVELDGVDLKWIPRQDIGVDRWHYDVHRNSSLEGGVHELKFTLLNGKLEGEAQLCSAEILEFGNEKEFIGTPGHYSHFPTFSDRNLTRYRPTNEDCLMRIVTTPNFCSVCLEELWLSLLKRVSLVDSLETSCKQDVSSGKWLRSFDLTLLPLAQYRQKLRDGESYSIAWLKDGVQLDEFNDLLHVEVEDQAGVYSAVVKFSTPEVRIDVDHLLTSEVKFSIDFTCV